MCEQQGEEKRRKEDDTYKTSTRYWLQDVTYHSLDTYRNWRRSMEIWISRHVWPKRYLSFPINYQTLNSLSKIAELKHGLMHKWTTFWVSSLFHCFLMSARSGSIRQYNISSNTISRDRTSKHIPVVYILCTPFLPKNPNLSQVKNSSTQIYTLHYYIAEI